MLSQKYQKIQNQLHKQISLQHIIVFIQTITVTVTPGELAITTDPEGNIIGSSEIDEDGTITYEIDEGMLLGCIIKEDKTIQNNINKQVDL